MRLRWLNLTIFYFVLCVVSVSAVPPLIQPNAYPEHEVLSVMQNVCDWQIANEYDASATWHYGALLPGITAAGEARKQDSYIDDAVAWAEKFNWELLDRIFHADDHTCGQTYLDLYMLDSPQAVRIAHTQSTMDYIIANPQTFSCTTRTAKVYDWIDALFMSPPVWARLSHITGDSIYINEMHGLWMDCQNCLYNDDNDHDNETPDYLWWRDKNYIDDRNPDGSKVFWGRGNGWVAGGLVRVLQFTPAGDPSRANYVTILQQMANALKNAQGADGCWRSNILYPEQYPNPETSGTSFFTYLIAYGVNEGLLDASVYGPVIEASWNGLVTLAVHPDGKLGYVQPVGAGPAAATYESTHVYGVGGFLMAGSEMYKYYQAQNADVLEDFESYSIYNPLKETLSNTWKGQADNGTTATISLDGIANRNIRIDYDNSQSPYMAEAYRDFSPAKNFQSDGRKILTLYLKGQAGNIADEFYCKLIDINDQTAVQRITDTSIITTPDWVQINFDLSEFASLDLTQVKWLVLGIGADNPSVPAGAGTVWVDEIQLSSRKCLASLSIADFDGNCEVNISDFAEIAAEWLNQYEVILEPVEPDPANMTAWWTFDETDGGTAYDSTAHGRDCTLFGATWEPTGGKYGGAISINGEISPSNRVEMPTTAINLAQGTYSVWLYLNPDQNSTDPARYIWGHTTLPPWGNRMQLYMDNDNTQLDCGMGATHSSTTSIQTLNTQVWHHVALTWDGTNYQVYVDGVLKASGAYSGLSQLQSVAHIGNNGHNDPQYADQAFRGLMDDIRLYDTVLTDLEILYLAEAETSIENPLPIDLKPDGIIDMDDLILFLPEWVIDTTWP